MGNLSSKSQYYRSKVAPFEGGDLRLLWDFTNYPTGAFTNERPQFASDPITILKTNLTIDSAGLTNSANSASMQIEDLPQWTGNGRRYCVNVNAIHTGAPINTLLDIFINIDSAVQNWWNWRMIVVSGAWYSQIYSVTSGSPTLRDTDNPSAAIEDCTASVVIEDYGDTIHMMTMWKELSTTSQDVTIMTFTQASREHKSNTGIRLGWQFDTGKISVQSLMVQDF